MSKRDIRTVAITLAVVAAVVAVLTGVNALRRESMPGREAAAYLNALIRLKKMPTAQQVNAWLAEAQPSIEVVEATPGGANPAPPAPEEKK